VSIKVYGLDGGLVRTLVEGPQRAGKHTIDWDGRTSRGQQTPAGFYVVRMDAPGFVAMRKVLLVR
jgi:flagellar hook assembly protein FlgD